MSTGQAPSHHTSEDEQTLHRLGYAQELFRAMGGFRNFAISFTIISILAGCLTSYTIAFEHGGPVAVTWGWLLVGLMSTLIALSMAEIASAYPTAGGLYYWSSKLGGPGWGWATGWFNLIGQIAVTAAIGYGLAVFAQVLFDYWFNYTAHMDDWFGASFNMSTYILYAAFLLAAVIINMFNIRLTSGLNMISAWWHMVGVVLVVGILIIVPDQHQSLSYVFTETVNNSGYGGGTTSFSNPAFWFVFGLGLLMSQYTITGFDASAHTAEETANASRMAATGMWTSVFVSVVFGWILLLAVTFAVPDTQATIDTANELLPIVPFIWAQSMSQQWAELLLFICVVAQFFCVTASTTSASRMIFAFSRDRAVPGHQLWRRVAKNRVPQVVGAVRRILVRDPHGAGDLELLHRLCGRNGDRGDRPLHRVHHSRLPPLEEGRQLGRAAGMEPRTALQVARRRSRSCGSVLITILFIFPLYTVGLPWNNPFDWQFTNYTILWFAGIGLVFGGWWALSAKNWFTGPVRMGSEEELARLEAEQAGQFALPTEAS